MSSLSFSPMLIANLNRILGESVQDDGSRPVRQLLPQKQLECPEATKVPVTWRNVQTGNTAYSTATLTRKNPKTFCPIPSKTILAPAKMPPHSLNSPLPITHCTILLTVPHFTSLLKVKVRTFLLRVLNNSTVCLHVRFPTSTTHSAAPLAVARVRVYLELPLAQVLDVPVAVLLELDAGLLARHLGGRALHRQVHVHRRLHRRTPQQDLHARAPANLSSTHADCDESSLR